jgi:hypothetical protein
MRVLLACDPDLGSLEEVWGTEEGLERVTDREANGG